MSAYLSILRFAASASLAMLACAATVMARQRPDATDPAAPGRTRAPGHGAAGRFVANRGQVHWTDGARCDDVLFTMRDRGVELFLTADGVRYLFEKRNPIARGGNDPDMDPHREFPYTPAPAVALSHRMDMRLLGARATRIYGDDRADYFHNYYLPDSPGGILGVPIFGRVVYENVYANIDLVYYSSEGGVKYDFIVHPGGDISAIRFRYDGASGLRLTGTGSIAASNPLGTLEEAPPLAWQSENGRVVSARFALRDGVAGFVVGPYDRTRTLVIDPAVRWSTYFGGTYNNLHYGTVTDPDKGTTVAVGESTGDRLPRTTLTIQSTPNLLNDAIITAFRPDGEPQWSTFFGGPGGDGATAVAFDPIANTYIVTGYTESDVLPTGLPRTRDSLAGGFDFFLLRLDGAGRRVWGRRFGGAGDDLPAALFIHLNDADRSTIVVAGRTSSTDLPISTLALQPRHSASPGFDGIIARFAADSGTFIDGTYFGGDSADALTGVTEDLTDNIVVCGDTRSRFFPATTPSHGGRDAMFAVIEFDCSRLKSSSRFGGSGDDQALGVAFDQRHAMYFVGRTSSADFTPALSGRFNNDRDAFIARYDDFPNWHRIWGSYIGGSGDDALSSVAAFAVGLGDSSTVLAVGHTFSETIAGRPDSSIGGIAATSSGRGDGLVALISSVNDHPPVPRLLEGVGGSGLDVLTGVSLGPGGLASIVGFSSSKNFPTTKGAYSDTSGTAGDSSYADAIVMMLDLDRPGDIAIREPADPFARSVTAYPNPARTGVSMAFSLPAPDVVTIAVYAVDGRRVAVPVDGRAYPRGDHAETIDLAGLPAGDYVLVIAASGWAVTRLVSVIR